MNKQDEWVEVYEGIQRETRVMDSGRGREASDGGERREIAEHGYALGRDVTQLPEGVGAAQGYISSG